MTDRSDTATDDCGCKLGRIAAAYDLDGLDERLVAAWTGENGDRDSTRTLATRVNRRVLSSALESAGVSPKSGEVENTYRLLTDDDVTSGTRVETRNDLEREGVPVEEVESNFVSHQTVYTHLTDCLEASLESPSEADRLERAGEKLGALQNRTELVTEDTIAQLERNDVVDVGDVDVLVSVTVTCQDCHRQYSIRELLEERSCGCRDD